MRLFFLIRHHITFPLLFLFWLHSFILALFPSFFFVFCFISLVSFCFSLSSSLVRFLSLLLFLHFPSFIFSAFLDVYPSFFSFLQFLYFFSLFFLVCVAFSLFYFFLPFSLNFFSLPFFFVIFLAFFSCFFFTWFTVYLLS